MKVPKTNRDNLNDQQVCLSSKTASTVEIQPTPKTFRFIRNNTVTQSAKQKLETD